MLQHWGRRVKPSTVVSVDTPGRQGGLSDRNIRLRYV